MLNDLLRQHRDAVLKRWTDSVIQSYPPETVKFLLREKDPFANPVGAATHTALPAILDYLIDGGDRDQFEDTIDQFIKIRSIQEFMPMQALGFIFLLKGIVRGELGKRARDPEINAGLLEFESAIDGVALICFQKYVKAHDQLHKMQAGAFERRTRVLGERMNRMCGGQMPEVGWDDESEEGKPESEV